MYTVLCNRWVEENIGDLCLYDVSSRYHLSELRLPVKGHQQKLCYQVSTCGPCPDIQH